jgi:serine/threonine protein kinase
MPLASSDKLLGTTLGGSRIEKRLAKGLLADVYLASNESLNAPVAVKVLSPKAMAQGMSTERFIREGRALAQLTHPNIVKIHNVGVEQNRYFIIMDFIRDGANLRALAKRHLLKPYQAMIITRRIAEALVYIHARQLIHRDIKPANICLRSNGQPVLMDFSLIKDESADIQLTAPGTIMGTVNFMPPEQAQPGGPFGGVTPLSDIYSLGATFYWLLTGQPPFKGRTPMETIIKLIRDPIIPPSKLNPSVPTELDALCLKALNKNPAERYESAAVFIQSIDAAVHRKRAEIQAAAAPTVGTEEPSIAPASPKGAAGWGAPVATPSVQGNIMSALEDDQAAGLAYERRAATEGPAELKSTWTLPPTHTLDLGAARPEATAAAPASPVTAAPPTPKASEVSPAPASLDQAATPDEPPPTKTTSTRHGRAFRRPAELEQPDATSSYRIAVGVLLIVATALLVACVYLVVFTSGN